MDIKKITIVFKKIYNFFHMIMYYFYYFKINRSILLMYVMVLVVWSIKSVILHEYPRFLFSLTPFVLLWFCMINEQKCKDNYPKHSLESYKYWLLPSYFVDSLSQNILVRLCFTPELQECWTFRLRHICAPFML